jgi:MFS family permease
MQQKTLLMGWWVCGLGALFYCYEYLIRISPSIMSTELRQAFELDATAFGSFAALYYFASVPMQLVGGVLMDRYGPRRLIIIACLVCACGVYLFTQYSHPSLAKIGRFIGGMGGAFAFIGALKLASFWVPPRQFGIVSGLINSLGMLGAMMGDVFLGVVINAWGWQQTLFAFSIAGFVVSGALFFGIPQKHPDYLHAAPNPPPNNGFKELVADLSLLVRNRYIWINGTIGCMLYLSLSVFAELWGPQYLQGAYFYTPAEASRGIAMVFFGWLVGSPLTAWLSERINSRRLPIFVANLLITVVISLIFYLPATTPKLLILLLLFLFGLFSSAQMVVFMIGKELAGTPRLTGTALAFTNSLSLLGGALLQPIVGKLLDWQWQGTMVNQLRVYTPHEYHMALIVLPIGTLLAAGLVLFLKETAPNKIA